MRFRLEREVWVEVDSIEQLVELEDAAGEALEQALEKHLIKEPDSGATGGSSLKGLDAESEAALDAYAAEHWDD